MYSRHMHARSSDFYSYEGMTDVLVSVQLLRPKKGTIDLHAMH